MKLDNFLMVGAVVTGIMDMIIGVVAASNDQYDKAAYFIAFAVLMYLVSQSCSDRLRRG